MGLGLVIVLMNRVRQPESAARLQQVFAPERRLSDAEVHALTTQTDNKLPRNLPNGAFHMPRAVEPLAKATASHFDGVQPELLAAIRDNTHFRSRETGAWFHLLSILQQTTAAELASASRGEIGYVQLIEQPQVYRGQVVTVRGSVRRAETVAAAENDIGLDDYHLLTIRPTGGQIWPIRAYCLNLPPAFPEGDDIATEVKVTGFFFKNWSYNWEGGMGLAPVVLARNIEWLDRERKGP